MTVLFILVLLLAGLLLSVLIDPYITQGKRLLLIEIVLLELSLVLQNYTEYRLETDIAMPYLRIIVGIIGYCARPMILGLFCSIFSPQRDLKYVVTWVLIAINAAIHCTSLFSDVSFTITAGNSFLMGPTRLYLPYNKRDASFLPVAPDL